MNSLKSADYLNFFPENLKKYKNLRCLAGEFESTFKAEIVNEIDKLAIYSNLHIQSDEVLSELAWQFNVDDYKENLDRKTKIELIKEACYTHSVKGTKRAIVDNLKKLNFELTVQEWFEYGGKPFTFRIVIKPGMKVSETWIDDLQYILNKYKNCRSILDEIVALREKEPYNYKVAAFRTIETERQAVRKNDSRELRGKIRIEGFRCMEVESKR